MTAFKQVLTNLQAGQREEAMIGLEFVVRLDPKFAPANHLQRQLASSSNEIDLGDIIAQLQAPTTDAINGLLIEAVDDFNSREFITAKEKVERVLIDLPGHQEARDLRDQVDKALKIENQVGQFLIQAREALAGGDPQEAANFVMMAQALDPHHTGIASTLKEIDQTGGLALSQDAPADSPVQPDEIDELVEAAPFQTDNVPFQTDAIPFEESPFQEEAPSPAPPADPPPVEPPPMDPPPATDDNDAFAVEFDTTDPFADLVDAPAEEDFGTTPEFDGGEDVSFPAMDDTADLFTAPGGTDAIADPAMAPPPGSGGGAAQEGQELPDDESVAERISELIDAGQSAYDSGDEPQAIASWSRVFLMKPNHPEAGHLIVRAKKRMAETEGKTEEVLAKARDAFDEGEYEAASLLVSKALGLRPNHLGVAVLREELERELGAQVTDGSTTSDAGPSEPEMPDLDDDLFSDLTAGDGDSPLTEDGASGLAGAGDDDDLFSDDDDDFVDFDQVSLLDRLKAKLSMRALAIGGTALVVVLVGVWLGGTFMSSEPEVDESVAVNEVLVEADRLFKEHKVEEALHLLREFPAAGLSQQRIDLRIAKYEEDLAPPTPTPVPEQASRAQTLLDQGLWWSAYLAAGEGLASHPDDTGLEQLRSLVMEIEPEAAVLDDALAAGDFRSAVSISEELLLQYPGQGDLVVVLERSLFNAALAESRAYNLTGAEKHLVRLLEMKPEDDEAIRFLDFVQKYKVRAADMRLEIFIRSMNER